MSRGLVLSVILACVGCGGPSVGPNGHDVGGSCSSVRECSSYCTFDTDFGNGVTGMCTGRCSTDRDCPNGTSCVTNDGGVCAVTCGATSECAGFGRAYLCKAENRTSGGSINVCRLP